MFIFLLVFCEHKVIFEVRDLSRFNNSIGEIIKTVASNLLRRDVVNIDTFEGT